MKKIVEEVEGEGLVKLLGQRVTLFCMNYFYSGVLKGVNTEDVLLEDAQIVYDTGPFDKKDWATAEKLPSKQWYVRISAIESYGVLK